MFKKQEIEKFLALDIETVSGMRNYKELSETNPKLAELWDHRTIYLREKYSDNTLKTNDEIYESKAGLHSEFGKIVCVSMASLKSNGTISTASSYGDDEAEVINKALKVIDQFMGKAMGQGRIVGHNLKRFDIPVLCKRAIINRVSIPPCLMLHKLKPWEYPILDTAELWSHGAWQEGFVGLDLLSTVLGIESPKDDMDATEVQNKYWTEGKIEDIKTYCEKDVKATLNALLRMCNLDPAI